MQTCLYRKVPSQTHVTALPGTAMLKPVAAVPKSMPMLYVMGAADASIAVTLFKPWTCTDTVTQYMYLVHALTVQSCKASLVLDRLHRQHVQQVRGRALKQALHISMRRSIVVPMELDLCETEAPATSPAQSILRRVQV